MRSCTRIILKFIVSTIISVNAACIGDRQISTFNA